MGILSKENNPYDIAPGIVFSFPCFSFGKDDIEIVSSLKMTPFLKEKIAITQKELIEERETIAHLLRG